MADLTAGNRVKQFSIEAEVIRCRCGHPSDHPDSPCPVGKVEDHGTVSYYHRNPLVRLKFWLMRKINPSARYWSGGEPK
jgi:hypothetical protein